MRLRSIIVVLVVVLLSGCGGGASLKDGIESGAAFEGIASYYHDSLHGNRTASGEVYDRNALTAAHRTLPFGTEVRVTNPANGKSVRLRINDRGPFVRGRVIDVSHRAAELLDFVVDGLVRVRVEIVAMPAG